MPTIDIPQLPADTARAAELAFGRDHLYLKIGRQIEDLLNDFDLPPSVKENAFLAEMFWPYSLASILQFWEDLTDHQMVNATRTRLDLKYALRLPLNFPGFRPLALCMFRQHALDNAALQEGFQRLLDHLREFAEGLDKGRAKAEQVLGTVCLLSRAEMITETMSNALEAIAVHCPNWLLSNALPHWYELYYQKPRPQRIPRDPARIAALLQTVGRDGVYLLETVNKTNPLDCRNLPEVRNLQREWGCQFERRDGSLLLRSITCHLCYSGIG